MLRDTLAGAGTVALRALGIGAAGGGVAGVHHLWRAGDR